MSHKLNVFIDETGDPGNYEKHSPFYIISFVFHEENSHIESEIEHLNQKVDQFYNKTYFHCGPMIRGENEFEFEETETRIKLSMVLASFIRRIPIRCHSIFVRKRNIKCYDELVLLLVKQLNRFIVDKLSYFQSFDLIVIYYDNGQNIVKRIVGSTFNKLLNNTSFKKVNPKEYRLFQVADFICTFKNIELKMQDKILSKSEKAFFHYDKRTLLKQYLNLINSKTLDN